MKEPMECKGLWFKDLNGIDSRIAEQFYEMIRAGVVWTWMTASRTLLCAKDNFQGNAADSYKPISCLPLTWKVFTGTAGDQIYT